MIIGNPYQRFPIFFSFSVRCFPSLLSLLRPSEIQKASSPHRDRLNLFVICPALQSLHDAVLYEGGHSLGQSNQSVFLKLAHGMNQTFNVVGSD